MYRQGYVKSADDFDEVRDYDDEISDAIEYIDSHDLAPEMGPFINVDQFYYMGDFEDTIKDAGGPLEIARMIMPQFDAFCPYDECFVYNADKGEYRSYRTFHDMIDQYYHDIFTDVLNGNDFGMELFADIIEKYNL